MGTTIGFPLGANLPSVKRFEDEQMSKLGARELDMVMNIAALQCGDRQLVESDIRGVGEAAHQQRAIVKVILEMPILTEEVACELCVDAGAHFVKTATGYLGGATLDDVRLMRSMVGDRARVKASGGVRTPADVAATAEAGANRIGTSFGVKIMQEMGAPRLPAQ